MKRKPRRQELILIYMVSLVDFEIHKTMLFLEAFQKQNSISDVVFGQAPFSEMPE